MVSAQSEVPLAIALPSGNAAGRLVSLGVARAAAVACFLAGGMAGGVSLARIWISSYGGGQ